MTRMQTRMNLALVVAALAGAAIVASCGQSGTTTGDAGGADTAAAMTAE